jgi:hypothetical protein
MPHSTCESYKWLLPARPSCERSSQTSCSCSCSSRHLPLHSLVVADSGSERVASASPRSSTSLASLLGSRRGIERVASASPRSSTSLASLLGSRSGSEPALLSWGRDAVRFVQIDQGGHGAAARAGGRARRRWRRTARELAAFPEGRARPDPPAEPAAIHVRLPLVRRANKDNSGLGRSMPRVWASDRRSPGHVTASRHRVLVSPVNQTLLNCSSVMSLTLAAP